MKTKTILSAIVAISTGLFSLNCSNTIGNGSDIGNAVVVGKLYAADGVSPAAGVWVHIRPKKSLADTSGVGLIKRLASLTAEDSVKTDNAGRFAFDSTLDIGTYVITSASGNNAVLIDSVKVTNRDSTDTLPPDTLKPAGALKGVIKLSEGGDTRKVFILAFGIDGFARVEADGRFKFQNLAEAKYDLRIISSLDDYGVLDTNAISVKSKDTTDLDTIELPFTGIPTPRNVRIQYDTLKQIVTVMWDNADTALVKGYNVYRRNVDSNTVPVRINASPVMDTFFRDSTGVQGATYEYTVAAVNKSATEGTKSAAMSVNVVGAFALIDSVGEGKGLVGGQLDRPLDLLIRNSGAICVADDTIGIKIFSSTKLYTNTLPCSLSIAIHFKRMLKLAKDSEDNLYVTGITYDGKGGILKCDAKDSAIMAFGNRGTGDSILGFPFRIVVSDTISYVENTDDRFIKAYSVNTGAFLFKFGGVGANNGQFVEVKGMDISPQKQILICEEKRVQVFNERGEFLNSFSINVGMPSSLKINKSDDIFISSVSNNSIIGFNPDGRHFATFSVGKEPVLSFIDTQNNFYIGYNNQSIFEQYH